MQHHNPHPGAAFEGYFSRFDLPSGATLVLVLCSVHGSPSPKSNYVSLRYIPVGPEVRDFTEVNMYQMDLWTANFSLTRSARGGFVLEASGSAAAGSLVTGKDKNVEMINSSSTTVRLDASPNQTNYHIQNADLGLSFHATCTSRVPWHYLPEHYNLSSTPEGILAYLPLPLHWHVHSLASQASFSLQLPTNADQLEFDGCGTALVHEEKNWATGFPKAHVWALGRNFANEQHKTLSGPAKLKSSICMAGGKILGLEAFLINYSHRERNLSVDFKPPIAIRLLGCSPFTSFKRDFPSRSFEITVSGLLYSICIKARAPKQSFIAFAAPWPEGFRENMMSESLKGQIEVTVWKRCWWLLGWRRVLEDIFENCGVEFGGEYFPHAGSDQRVN